MVLTSLENGDNEEAKDDNCWIIISATLLLPNLILITNLDWPRLKYKCDTRDPLALRLVELVADGIVGRVVLGYPFISCR